MDITATSQSSTTTSPNTTTPNSQTVYDHLKAAFRSAQVPADAVFDYFNQHGPTEMAKRLLFSITLVDIPVPEAPEAIGPYLARLKEESSRFKLAETAPTSSNAVPPPQATLQRAFYPIGLVANGTSSGSVQYTEPMYFYHNTTLADLEDELIEFLITETEDDDYPPLSLLEPAQLLSLLNVFFEYKLNNEGYLDYDDTDFPGEMSINWDTAESHGSECDEDWEVTTPVSAFDPESHQGRALRQFIDNYSAALADQE